MNQFAIKDKIKFVPGSGGLTIAEITTPMGTAKVALHGAHVLSFIPTGQRDILWCSSKSWYEPGKPIRGGIPVCWPWFGGCNWNSELPSHGFARISAWEVVETGELENDGAFITLQLVDSPETRAMWDYAFKARIRVEVAEKLTVSLIIDNTGDKEFCFSAALHNYFAISNITDITILGLEKTRFVDTLDDQIKSQYHSIKIAKEFDNVYFDTDATCIIDDPGYDRKIRIAKRGSNSTVIWNPWDAKATRMPDYGDNEYPQMVCIETTNAENDVRSVKPGKSHTLTTIIS
jgi:glucose-6-phosphate 1-epimerase